MDQIKPGDIVARFRDGPNEYPNWKSPPIGAPVMVSEVAICWSPFGRGVGLSLVGYPLPDDFLHTAFYYRKLVDDTSLAPDRMRVPEPV